jgi:flagellar basal-body rod modification protein FlgD
MNVSLPMISSTANTTSTSATSASSQATVDYDTFLQLLVTQMKNQDPLSPMDSTEYVAQLATFSQVEQSIQINEKLDELLQGSALSQADALIGREITSADGKTTGIVKEVKLNSNGITAVLEGGEEVAVEPGVVIRPAEA